MPRDPRVTDEFREKLKRKAMRVLSQNFHMSPAELERVAESYVEQMSLDYDIAEHWLAMGGSETVN